MVIFVTNTRVCQHTRRKTSLNLFPINCATLLLTKRPLLPLPTLDLTQGFMKAKASALVLLAEPLVSQGPLLPSPGPFPCKLSFVDKNL